MGADVFGQRFMMIMLLKDLEFKYNTVDVRYQHKKLPLLEFEDQTIDDVGKIETFLERGLNPKLASEDPEVNKLVNLGAGSGVFHKFCQLVRNADPSGDEPLRRGLHEELRKLNGFLVSDKMPGPFLFGETPGIPDCILLPKLLHIKVVAKEFKGFELPEDLTGIHKYLEEASKMEAFTKTSPAEDVIVDGWAKNLKLPNPRAKGKPLKRL